MADSHILGHDGEDKAVDFLVSKGYKILHRNWKSGKKELDIVAEHKEYIVFVEVKTRTKAFVSDPRYTVPKEKQKMMIYAADAYIQRYNINKESRFDIVTIVTNGKVDETEHIEDAFYPTLR
jgi:putative endonuclease